MTEVPYFEEADIPAMLEGAGQDVTLGGVTVSGLFDQETVEVLSGSGAPIEGEKIVITVQTGSLTALAVGASLTTGGKMYKVREYRQVGDGALTEIECSED